MNRKLQPDSDLDNGQYDDSAKHGNVHPFPQISLYDAVACVPLVQ